MRKNGKTEEFEKTGKTRERARRRAGPGRAAGALFVRQGNRAGGVGRGSRVEAQAYVYVQTRMWTGAGGQGQGPETGGRCGFLRGVI